MELKPKAIREVVRKKLGWFKTDNVRKQFNEEEDRRLGKSIEDRLMHPLAAKPDGTLIDGERRLRAAKLVGMEELDVIIIDEPMTQSELRLLQAATVFHRSDWTAGEKYEFVYEQVQLNPTWQAKEVAEHLHVDPGTLSKLLSFSKTIPAVREALKDGRLSINDGHAFSQLSEADQAELLPKRLSGEIANREEMVREGKARRSQNGKPGERTTRFKATLPGSSVSIALAAPALDMSGLIDVLSEALKLAKKADRERIGIKAFEAALRDQAKG